MSPLPALRDEVSMSKWINVTDALKAGASQLRVGEMLHTTTFDLAQAISAVEIGDARMDFPLDESTHLPSLLASGKMPKGLSLPVQLAVVESLLAKLAQWWTGVTLLQTVYTSLYMLAQQELTTDPFLKAACTAVTGIVSVSKLLVVQSMVVEEEDCPTFSPGVPEEPPITARYSQDVLAVVQAAIDKCGTVPKSDKPAATAMVARLKFLKLLFQALTQLQVSSVARCKKVRIQLTSAQECLSQVISTMPAVSTDPAPGIVPNIHCSAWSLPPPPVEQLSPEAAQQIYKDVLSQLIEICEIQNVKTLWEVKSFIAKVTDTSPIALCRGILHIQVCTRNVCDENALPCWAPYNNMLLQDMGLDKAIFLKAPDVRMFVEQAQLATANVIQTTCTNRSRFRRRLRKGFDDWSNMYTHATNADMTEQITQLMNGDSWRWQEVSSSNAPDGPCALWVERETCDTMLQHLLLGCELSLYTPAEFPTLYWYCDYLLTCQLTALHRFIVARPKQMHQRAKSNTPEGTFPPDERHRVGVEQIKLATIDLRRLICQGLLRLSIALQRADIISFKPPVFGQARDMFDQRFKCFKNIPSPIPLTYDNYLQSTDASEFTVEQLLQLPLEVFRRAWKSGQEALLTAKDFKIALPAHEITELQAMSASAKRNEVACMLLSTGYTATSGATLTATWDFATHRHFPTLVVKSNSKPSAA